MKKLIMLLLAVIIALPCMAASADAGNIPILLYHMVEEEDAGLDVIVSVTPAQLRLHLETIKNNGYTPITFTDYYNFITKGTKLPKKPVLTLLK